MNYFLNTSEGILPFWAQPLPVTEWGVECRHVPQPQWCEEPLNNDSYFSWPLILQLLVFLANFIVQVLAITFVYSKKQFQKGSFFVMLIVLAISVVSRSIVYVSTTIVAANTAGDPNYPETQKYKPVNLISTAIALHMDYCSNYFSMVLIFFMALNRCLFFTAEKWNGWIFNRVWIPIVCSLISGVVSSEIIIFTNGMKRIHVARLGYVDYGEKEGYRYIINRIFHLFPIGAVICYAILLRTLKKENRNIMSRENSNNPRNRGNQQVFLQLMFTSIFYSAMSLIVELLQLINFSDETTQTLIAFLNIFNYLPEVSLPFFLVFKSLMERRKVAVMIQPSRSRS